MTIAHRIGAETARFAARALPKRLVCSPRYFSVWESAGYHIVPLYHESPVPQPSELGKQLWQQPSEMYAIDLRDAHQIHLLETFRSRFKAEYDTLPRNAPAAGGGFHLNNGWFEKVDAEILYCMIREFRPAQIVEVGSGVTTKLAAQAIRKNEQEDASYVCDFTAIEPLPVRIDVKALPPVFNLMQERVQEVPLSKLTFLGENDILFIDSSHVCRTGSDVNYLILEVLPRLHQGVLIHFHDIFLPWDYPRSWVIDNHRFLNEQYLLRAFLTCNPLFEIVWGSYYMLHKNPGALDSAFATFREDITGPGTFLPGSFWLRRVK